MLTLNETFAVEDSARAWRIVNDLEALVPCVPGARVTSVEGPQAVRAEIAVRMGAMGMTFAGPVRIESSDAAGHAVAIKADTRETLGHSYATGDITIRVEEGEVRIVAVADVGGKAAGMGEGVIVNVLTDLVRSFSTNVAAAAAEARAVQAVNFGDVALERMKRFTSPAEGDSGLGGTRAARSATGADASAIFSSVTRVLSGRLDVTQTSGPGGGPLLKARGQSFAMLHDSELVVKLHPLRCADLIGEGRGRLLVLDGATLEDWFVVGGVDASEWSARAKEALACACG